MVEPLRHRQTKGAETDMFDLQLPRHISTLPLTDVPIALPHVCFEGEERKWRGLAAMSLSVKGFG